MHFMTLFLVVTLCTCSGSVPSASGTPDRPATSEAAAAATTSEMTFRLIDRGVLGRAANADMETADRTPMMEIASSGNRYESLWRTHINDTPAPSVDFEKESVVFLIMGPRPTGGYAVTPESVTRSGNDLFVKTRIQEPEKGAMTTQAFTAPYAVIAVPMPRARAGRWVRSDGSLMAVENGGNVQ